MVTEAVTPASPTQQERPSIPTTPVAEGQRSQINSSRGGVSTPGQRSPVGQGSPTSGQNVPKTPAQTPGRYSFIHVYKY